MGTTTNYREGMEISGRFSPSTTAILTMEMQRGVCGDLATFRALQDAVADGVADRVGNLLDTARRNSFMVVHCIFTLRADRAGTQMDLPIMTAARKNPNYLLQGTDSVALMPELRQVSTDVVCERHHGVSPFSGTNLDTQLRQQGINTLIVVGVSLNLGILGLAIEAVNLGYSVVIAADAVAGFPAQYAQDVLRHSLIAITEQATVAQIIAGLTASSATDPTHK